MRGNADKVFLAAFLALLLFLGWTRLDYAGDGLRHLQPLIEARFPILGEPRWILFPSVLFFVIKPFVWVGVVTSASQAAKVFCLFNVICGFLYLLLLRRWLLDASPVRRTAVLLLAGSTFVFLTLATDTTEPAPATVLAVAGLTAARFASHLSTALRIIIAVGGIALAGLVYQGLLFGLFFIPAIFPLRVIWREAGIGVAGAILLVPIIVVALLCLSGETPARAIHRFVNGEANPASSQQYSKISLKNAAGVAVAGPTYALASIPQLRGLAGTLRLLRSPETVPEAIWGSAAWLLALFFLTSVIIMLLRARELPLIFAFVGIMILPAIRMSQYSYTKYYVLLPLFIALAVGELGTYRLAALFGAALLASNVSQMLSHTADLQTLNQRVAEELYPRLPVSTCFLTSGWGPPIQEWPGKSLSWAHILNGGNGDSQDRVGEANSAVLRSRLKDLFCGCSAIVTDGITGTNLSEIQRKFADFGIRNIPIADIVASPRDSPEVFRTSRFSVYRYSSGQQKSVCLQLNR